MDLSATYGRKAASQLARETGHAVRLHGPDNVVQFTPLSPRRCRRVVIETREPESITADEALVLGDFNAWNGS